MNILKKERINGVILTVIILAFILVFGIIAIKDVASKEINDENTTYTSLTRMEDALINSTSIHYKLSDVAGSTIEHKIGMSATVK